ncbi:MAG: response regulator transcription factor [Planctomycetaceae bacterium]|nr:response regulator transcription factor [Planctomycetaceae bacterium]
MAVRIVVIEPLEIVRLGVRALLGSLEYGLHRIEVVAEGSSPKDMVPLAAKFEPDIVLTEVQFPDMTGFNAIDSLKQAFPGAKVFVYTASDNPAFLARAALSGVDEYLEKTAPTEELVAALIRLSDGQARPAGHKLDRVSGRMKSKRVSTEHEMPLTGRELQVLRHIAFGMSNKEIARSLELSVDTVKEHVQNILRKMGFRDRTHAAVWAVRKKII